MPKDADRVEFFRQKRQHTTQYGSGKIPHPTREGAEISCREMHEKHPEFRYCAYECSVCGFWHIGKEKYPGGRDAYTEFLRMMYVEIGPRALGNMEAENRGPIPNRIELLVHRGLRGRLGRYPIKEHRMSRKRRRRMENA